MMVALLFPLSGGCDEASTTRLSEGSQQDALIDGVASKLDQKQAIEYAKQYATEEGIRLADYKKIVATFEPKTKTWDVSFMMDPMPPGGYFDVLIEDDSGKFIALHRGE